MSKASYPKRPPYFAHQVVRMAFKTCAAQEIGQTAALLIMFIVHTEDAKHYSSAPNFFNDQLLPILGLRKWEALNKARRAAVEAGWLYYEAPPSGTRKPGTYWALIPERFANLSDAPVDEEPSPVDGDGHAGAYPPSGDACDKPYPPNGDGGGYGRGYGRGDGRGELPSLSLDPVPKRVSASPPSPNGDTTSGDRLQKEMEFVGRWNQLTGVVRNRGQRLTDARRRTFRVRLKVDGWLGDAATAMDKFPLPLQQAADGSLRPDAWKPDIEWFLKADSVTKIVEGKYDWSKGGNGAAPEAKPKLRMFTDES